MSKLAPFALAGVGAAATSVGGVYLIKGTTAPHRPAINHDLGFTGLEDFRKQKGGDCAKHLFRELDYDNGKGTALGTGTTITAADFNGTPDSPIESCLVVNWEKTNAPTSGTANKKGRGNIRWLWSFKRGKKGFVIFTTTQTSASDKTLALEGGIYFVEQASDSDTWSIKKHKEITSSGSKTIVADGFDNKFPKKGSGIEGLTKASPDYWGFVTGASDLDHVCKTTDTDCPTGDPKTQSSFKGAWKGSSDATKSSAIDKWSASLTNHLSNMYGSAELNFGNAFDSIKGTGNKIRLTEA